MATTSSVEQQTFNRRLADKQRKRLEQLELIAAEQGSLTPAHLLVEIEGAAADRLRSSRSSQSATSSATEATMRAILLLSWAVASMESRCSGSTGCCR